MGLEVAQAAAGASPCDRAGGHAAVDEEVGVGNPREAAQSQDGSSDAPPPSEASSEAGADRAGGLAWWQASFSLVVVVIGAGVMALPQLPTKGGLGGCLLVMLLCGATVTESGLGMWKGVMAGNGASKAGGRACIVSYEDFGRAALGPLGEVLVVIMQLFYFLGVSASFAVLIAESASHLSRSWLTPQQFLLPLAPVFGMIALLPNVSAVARFVPAAVVCVVVLCGIIVGKAAMDSQRWQQWPDVKPGSLHKWWPSTFLDIGSAFATLFGAFGVNGNVPSVLCEMKDPSQFPLAFKTAMAIVFVIYATVMGVGYFAYGQFIQSDIVASLTSFPANEYQAFHVPFDEWTGPRSRVLEDVTSCLLLGKLMVGLPLNLMVVFYSLQTFRYTKNFVPVGSWRNTAMRLFVVVLAVFIARLVTNFGVLFALVCSVCGPPMQCILPLAFSFLVRRGMGGAPSSPLRRALHLGLGGVAAFTLTVGFWQSLHAALQPESSAGR
uniref:Amino acid transporter transmembrane domain-containing protein n=1 Tax=Zooxanthella nutricula TaxID=1333877 RepID=A0A7S2IZ49_9DINO